MVLSALFQVSVYLFPYFQPFKSSTSYTFALIDFIGSQLHNLNLLFIIFSSSFFLILLIISVITFCTNLRRVLNEQIGLIPFFSVYPALVPACSRFLLIQEHSGTSSPHSFYLFCFPFLPPQYTCISTINS